MHASAAVALLVVYLVAATLIEARPHHPNSSDPRTSLTQPQAKPQAAFSGSSEGRVEFHGAHGFPGSAQIALSDGSTVRMRDLKVGDRVVVLGLDGYVACDEVYAFERNDATAMTRFVRVSVSYTPNGPSQKEIILTPHHRLFSASGEEEGTAYGFTKAIGIQYGDRLMEVDASSLETLPLFVSGISLIYSTGLYAPMTRTGNIVVNGIVASVHSNPAASPLPDLI